MLFSFYILSSMLRLSIVKFITFKLRQYGLSHLMLWQFWEVVTTIPIYRRRKWGQRSEGLFNFSQLTPEINNGDSNPRNQCAPLSSTCISIFWGLMWPLWKQRTDGLRIHSFYPQLSLMQAKEDSKISQWTMSNLYQPASKSLSWGRSSFYPKIVCHHLPSMCPS